MEVIIMNEWLIVFGLWYAVGVILFLRTCWEIDPQILVKDVLVSFVVGLFGLVVLIIYLTYSENKWINHRIW